MATLLLTYAFRCQACNSTNNDKLVLTADDRQKLVRAVGQTHLGCKYCGMPRNVDRGVRISLEEPAPPPALSVKRRGITVIGDSEPGE